MADGAAGAAAIAAAVVLLVACGGGRHGLTPLEANQLASQIARARSAAASGDRAGTQSALAAVSAAVSGFRARGALSAAEAGQIQGNAVAARRDAQSLTSRSPTASTAPTPLLLLTPGRPADGVAPATRPQPPPVATSRRSSRAPQSRHRSRYRYISGRRYGKGGL